MYKYLLSSLVWLYIPRERLRETEKKNNLYDRRYDETKREISNYFLQCILELILWLKSIKRKNIYAICYETQRT